MKIAFIILVLIHGLIHLLGVAKAFGWSDVKELSLPISRAAGFWWLIATLLFVLYAFLFLFHQSTAWLAGLVAIIISQILTIWFWKDARFATIPNFLILLVCLVQVGAYRLQQEFRYHVEAAFASGNTLPADTLTAADIAHLPSPVQRYLHYCGFAGKPRINNFTASFSGGRRSNNNDEFMKVNSVQYNFCKEPARYFIMKASKKGLPAMGLHYYKQATATFRVKMLNWWNVVDEKGEKMNQAETVTVFNDMCFIAPGALIDHRIKWQTINDKEVKARFTNGNITITATLYFDDDGALVNFISNDRYHIDGKEYHSYPWSTPVSGYRTINGYRLPGKARLIYHTPQGEFVYGELHYESVEYNVQGLQKPVAW